MLLIGALAGCASTTREDKSSGLNEYGQQSSSVLSPNRGGSDAAGEWSIVLSRVASGRIEHAKMLLDTIQNQGGLPQAYIDERTTGLVIAYGHYSGADDSRAKSELERIRGIILNEGTPFSGAYIAPPSGSALQGSNPDFDLRNVKRRLGEDAVYTLQIGLYGSDDMNDPSAAELSEYRRAAEHAVAL
ncbi:MAG: hypothetical protein JKY96_04230, partial [Phycisphaerales bacterium]|nr:hypothetical protein [Phycisphaerales bacterium]